MENRTEELPAGFPAGRIYQEALREGVARRQRSRQRRRVAVNSLCALIVAAVAFGTVAGIRSGDDTRGVTVANPGGDVLAATTTTTAAPAPFPPDTTVAAPDAPTTNRVAPQAAPTTTSPSAVPPLLPTPVVPSRVQGVIYGIDDGGKLFWYRHNDPTGGAGGFANGGAGKEIGVGWRRYTQVFSGGAGVIYAVDETGKLFWYRHNDPVAGAPGFANGGAGKEIGTGWARYTKLFSGGNGVIYAVDETGRLFWYRHDDPTNGVAGFANGGAGREIGTGFNRYTHLFSGGGGVIYGIDESGKLFWYRHNDPAGGAGGFANGGAGTEIGISWGRYTRVFSGGGGVIYAIDGDGKLTWYRHLDSTGGAPGFANGGAGKEIGVGFSGSRWFAPPA